MKSPGRKNEPEKDPDMLDEYDFRDAVVGKYAARYRAGSTVVVLDPDVAQVFTNSEKVNQALRRLIEHQAREAAGGKPGR